LKASKKTVGLIIVVICAITILFYYLQQPKTSIIIQPKNTTISSVRKLTFPQNQSSIIIDAEQASFTRDGKEVNVTVIQTPNEGVAQSLYELLRVSFLAQGMTEEKLNLTGCAIKFSSLNRPYIILLTKNEYLVISSSTDQNLLLETVESQVVRP